MIRKNEELESRCFEYQGAERFARMSLEAYEHDVAGNRYNYQITDLTTKSGQCVRELRVRVPLDDWYVLEHQRFYNPLMDYLDKLETQGKPLPPHVDPRFWGMDSSIVCVGMVRSLEKETTEDRNLAHHIQG